MGFTPALLRHARALTNPASAARWERFWAAMSVVAVSPVIYVFAAWLTWSRYGVLRAIFAPADWFISLGCEPTGELTVIGVVAALILFVGMIAGYRVPDSISRRYGQRVRDLRGDAIQCRIRNGETPEPFVLYLRPFLSTGAHTVRRQKLGWKYGSVDYTHDYEDKLTRAAAPIGLLRRARREPRGHRRGSCERDRRRVEERRHWADAPRAAHRHVPDPRGPARCGRSSSSSPATRSRRRCSSTRRTRVTTTRRRWNGERSAGVSRVAGTSCRRKIRKAG